MRPFIGNSFVFPAFSSDMEVATLHLAAGHAWRHPRLLSTSPRAVRIGDEAMKFVGRNLPIFLEVEPG
jgi:hypothetical protein